MSKDALEARGWARWGEGVLRSKRLIGMRRMMGSHFHDCIDYNGVGRIVNRVTRMGSYIFRFLGVKKFFIFTVSKRTRMFVL